MRALRAKKASCCSSGALRTSRMVSEKGTNWKLSAQGLAQSCGTLQSSKCSKAAHRSCGWAARRQTPACAPARHKGRSVLHSSQAASQPASQSAGFSLCRLTQGPSPIPIMTIANGKCDASISACTVARSCLLRTPLGVSTDLVTCTSRDQTLRAHAARQGTSPAIGGPPGRLRAAPAGGTGCLTGPPSS